jgi:hypothetical protein
MRTFLAYLLLNNGSSTVVTGSWLRRYQYVGRVVDGAVETDQYLCSASQHICLIVCLFFSSFTQRCEEELIQALKISWPPVFVLTFKVSRALLVILHVLSVLIGNSL